MPIPVIEKLLILQDRDKRRRDLETLLQRIPAEIAAVEAKIASEKKEIELAKAELMGLETKKKGLDKEIASTEQQIARYKAQQLEVKKNDEYRALGQQIENTQTQVGGLEEQEIGVLYAIDEARKKFAAAEKTLKDNISGHENRIRQHREREQAVKTDLVKALEDFAAAKQPVEESALRLYERVAQRHFPACVAVNGSKCGGCHLKISSEVEADCRGKNAKLALCDQCGRIVWWES